MEKKHMMKAPNVFVDTSYAVYFVGYSTFSWYQREFRPKVPEDGSFDPMTDPEFKAEFEKRFKYKLFSVLSNHVSLLDRKRIHFCFDCKKVDIWRSSFFPEYKIMRRSLKKQFSWNSVFEFVKGTLVPNMCETMGCKSISVGGAEGDDIIAIGVRNSDRDNIIVASDNDFIQIASNRTMIVNLKDEILTLQTLAKRWDIEEEADGLSHGDYLKIKLITGDAGDEIPGIFPKVGVKTALKLINDRQAWREKMIEHPDAAAKLKRNMLLIDFNSIPEELCNEIKEKFQYE